MPSAPSSADSGELRVLVLHGLWQPSQVMWPLTTWLKHHGWNAHSVPWSPTGRTLEENARAVIDRHCADRTVSYALIGHSMGGLLARVMLAVDPTLPVDCVITLDTPHQGAHSAQLVREQVPFGDALIGKAWQNALDGDLPPWNAVCPLGQIICNDDSFWIRYLAPNEALRAHGRAVSPGEARLDGAEYAYVDADHTSMLVSGEVFRCCDRFLRTHSFNS